MNLVRIDQNVTSLLHNTSTRNTTNKEFIFKYWQKYDGLKTRVNLPIFRKLTDPESISRSRRKVVETNPHLEPNPNVLTAKRTKERKMRKHYLSS